MLLVKSFMFISLDASTLDQVVQDPLPGQVAHQPVEDIEPQQLQVPPPAGALNVSISSHVFYGSIMSLPGVSPILLLRHIIKYMTDKN